MPDLLEAQSSDPLERIFERDPEKPANPYVDFVLKQPQLRPGPLGGLEPGPADRFWANVEDARRYTLGGAGETVLYGSLPEEFDPTNPMEVENRARVDRIRQSQRRYDFMRPARTPLEYVAAGAGQVAGTLTSPESLASLPTRFVTSGATALSRVFRAGVSGAAINTAIDPAVQALRIEGGLQAEYSPTQTAASAALGFSLPGAAQGVIEALRGGSRLLPGADMSRRPGKAPTASPEAAAASSPEASPPSPAPEITPEQAGDLIDSAATTLRAEAGTTAPGTAQADAAPAAPPPTPAEVAPDIAPVFPDRPPESLAPPALPLQVEIAGKRAIFPDTEHRRLYELGKLLAEGQAPSPAEVTALLNDFRGYVVEEPDIGIQLQSEADVLELAKDYYDNLIDIAPSAAEPFRTGDVMTDDEARAAWREMQLERLRQSDPARAVVDEARPAAGVPFVMTQEMRRRLGELGHTPEQVGDMTPREAWDILKGEATTLPPGTIAAADQIAAGQRPQLEAVPDFSPDLPATPGKRAGVFLFDPRELQVDAATFQFKSGGDAEGITPILRGVTRWDADAAGQLVIWQRADGTLFVADGHQRAGLARRLLEAGSEADIRLPGSLYREADGWTAEQVMIAAALKNIREGSGDILDAAKILRVTPEAVSEIAEIGRTQTRQAVALSNLSETVWRMAVNDVIQPRDAAVIGRLIRENEELQQAAATLLARVSPSSEAETEILVRRVLNSELAKSEADAQGGLFGDLTGPESLVAEEIRIVAAATKILGRDKNIMKRIAVNADRIEQTGSRIERVAAVEAANEADRLRVMIEAMAFRRGPVRDSLLELARDLKNGKLSAAGAAESFVEAIRLGTPVGNAGRRDAGGGGSGDADSGEGLFGFVGQLRGRPLAGELGRSRSGVPANAIGGQSAPPEAARLKAISERVIKALGITVRQGRITKPKALGTYNERSGVVRLRELDAFVVLTHEGGHALHLRPQSKAAIDGLIASHAVEVERLAYQGTKQGRERIEGFAEWFRLWLTNPAYAQREAPTFTEALTRWMETSRPDVYQQLLEAQAAYRDWLQAASMPLVTGDLVSSGAPPIKTRVGRTLGTDRLPSGESLFSLFDRFYTWTLDRLHPVNRAVRTLLKIHERNTGNKLELTAAEDAYKLMRLATNAYQAGHVDLTYGVVPYRGLDPEGPSIGEALEIAVGKNWFGSWRSDELLDFGGYLVARRSIVEFQRFLAGEVPNPPGKLTLGDYRQAVADYEAAHPQFQRAATLLYEWQNNLLRKKFEAGLVSRTYYEGSLAKPDYVPFRRDFSEKVEDLIQAVGTGGTNRQSVMKTYRGSLRSIINPIESIMADAFDTAAIIARNDAIRAIAALARKAGPDGGGIAEIIPTHQVKPISVDIIEALRAAGREAGLNKNDIDDLILQVSEAFDADEVRAVLYRAGEAPEKGEPIVYFWEGGTRQALRLPDKRFGRELFEAVTQIGVEQSNWLINLLAIPARVLRIGITTSPEFVLANYIRDQVSAAIINPKFIPLASGARGIATELIGGRAARLYAQAGGIMGGANVASLNQARIARSISALQKKGYGIQRMKDPREWLKAIEVSETGTRVALFRQYFETAKRQGLSEYEAMIEAAFQARDYIDFGRHGSKMLFARRLVTFLNAALQGLDKTARTLGPMAKIFRGLPVTAKERAALAQSAGAWTKIGTLAALSATYAALYRDDPEFQEASEYLRATHWLFKLPGGEWAAIPKPYEMATLVNLGERFAEGMMAGDPAWADKWLRSWGYTLAIPMEPAGLMVPAELYFNYDTFRDRAIVQEWDLGKEPALQYYEWTSEFSKALGGAINVSPAKIDHLITGWAGSWGRNVLSLTNAVADPQRRSEHLYDWPVTQRFVKNLARGSDASEKFYGLLAETSGRLELKNNTYAAMLDRGQESEAATYYGSLTDDEKVWVAANQQANVDNKRIHPLRRASDIAEVLSGMRRDITNRNIVSVITNRSLTLNPTLAQAVQEQLMRASTAELRNAMIAVGEPGWAQRQVIETAPYYEAIEALAPDIAEEVGYRLRKKNVLPFDGVRAVWPEFRDRLLEDGPDAFVADLRAAAMRGANVVSPGIVPAPSQAPPEYAPQMR